MTAFDSETFLCENCGHQATVLYRLNQEGAKGIWYCITCIESAPDPDLHKLHDLFEKAQIS